MRKFALAVSTAALAFNAFAAPVPLTGNKAVLAKIYEAFNTNDARGLEFFVAREAALHDLPDGIRPGLQGTQDLLGLLNRAFPDFRILVQDMISENDRVAARILFTGTHQGEFMGIPSTGKQVAYTGIHYVRFANGKAVEIWSFMDHDRLRAQLQGPAGSTKK